LDINFPIKNGWDFLEEYKKFANRSSVILLSSSIDVVEKTKSKNYSPIIDFVSKPLTFEYVAKILT
jgi:response regulator of citrate/malate metabolism